MTRFLIRRLLNMIPLILGITFISFLAMSLVPGDFVSNLKLNPTITPEVIHQLEAQFGLDQPLMVRYSSTASASSASSSRAPSTPSSCR
jgi:peptide/nickel transport system permease protein